MAPTAWTTDYCRPFHGIRGTERRGGPDRGLARRFRHRAAAGRNDARRKRRTESRNCGIDSGWRARRTARCGSDERRVGSGGSGEGGGIYGRDGAGGRIHRFGKRAKETESVKGTFGDLMWGRPPVRAGPPDPLFFDPASRRGRRPRTGGPAPLCTLQDGLQILRERRPRHYQIASALFRGPLQIGAHV